MSSGRNRKNVLRIIGVVAGGVIGLVVGLLVAPKTGAQLRADVRRTGGVWKTKAGAKAAELTKSGSARLTNVRQSVGPVVASAREKGASLVSGIGGRKGRSDHGDAGKFRCSEWESRGNC